MTVSQARALTLPVPPRPYTVPDPWCECGHRRSGHHVTPSGTVSYCCTGGASGQCPCQKFTGAPPISRGELASALVPWAARLVEIVHGDGAESDVAAVLAAVARLPRPDDVNPLVALAVVLAAFAPAGVAPDRALSWITWDWQGSAS